MSDYTIYSDDSGAGDHRFQSLTLVAVPKNNVMDLDQQLAELVESSGTRCTEWKKVGRQVRYTQACKALFNVTNTLVSSYGVRFQTVIWDMHDARHTVQYRDDTTNKAYMYRMALVDLFKRHSMTDITWRPDTESGLDHRRIATDVMDRVPFGPSFTSISQSSPEQTPFLQLADLNAGLWRGYYERAENGREWYNAGRPAGCPSCTWSMCETKQYEIVLWYIDLLQKGGTTFERSNGVLKTRAFGERPFNVWPYVPQHEADKAPRRKTA